MSEEKKQVNIKEAPYSIEVDKDRIKELVNEVGLEEVKTRIYKLVDELISVLDKDAK